MQHPKISLTKGVDETEWEKSDVRDTHCPISFSKCSPLTCCLTVACLGTRNAVLASMDMIDECRL